MLNKEEFTAKSISGYNPTEHHENMHHEKFYLADNILLT